MNYLAESIEDARVLAAQEDHNATNILQNSTFDRYDQKGDFEVINVDINEWAICLPSPFFLPESPIADYLERGYFQSVKVDDECNLLVTLKDPINNPQDEDYIRESFDMALAWLPKWEIAEKAFVHFRWHEEQFKAAKKAWHEAQALLVA